MKLLNRDGPPPLPETTPRAVDASTLASALADGSAVAVDARSSADFAKGFIPGTINIPGGRSFATWAGALLSPERDLILIAGGEGRARGLIRELSLVGIDRVIGWAGVEVLDGWRRLGRALECVRTLEARDVATLRDATVIDVRAQDEWNAGRIPGARHLFLGDLPEATDDLPRDRLLVIACQGGSRSSIGASLLRARGFDNVINFSGGFAEWQRSGLPVETTPISPDPS